MKRNMFQRTPQIALLVSVVITSLMNRASLESIETVSSHGFIRKNANIMLARSSFESPVRFVDSGKHFFIGADEGYEWSNVSHYVNYIGGQLKVDVDCSIVTGFSHSGNKSLYLAVDRISGEPPYRVQVQLNSRTERRLYTSIWYCFPPSFSLPKDNTAWMMLDETWETPVNYQIKFALIVKRYANGTYYWQLRGDTACIYGNVTRLWGPYTNNTYGFPIGRWFRIEQYQTRSLTSGVVAYWIDGHALFNVTGVQTEHKANNSFVRDAIKLYFGSTGEDNSPYYCWADDLEVLDRLPSEKG